MRENYRIGSLCELEDPNIDVIYVSPMPVNDEILQYYTKLVSDLSDGLVYLGELRFIYARWLNKELSRRPYRNRPRNDLQLLSQKR